MRHNLLALLGALGDFTPHFLPPHEAQVPQALAFLDGATDIVHRLPEWDSYQNSVLKVDAYEEISRAWTMVLNEAAKRAGGIQLQYDGWDKKILKHNEQARGKMQDVVNTLNSILGWAGGQVQAQNQNQNQNQSSRGDDINSIRQELLSGTYGSNLGVRVGPW